MCSTKIQSPSIVGYITHDLTDKFGRLLLAEGTPVTSRVLRKLEDRKINFHLSGEPPERAENIVSPFQLESPFEIAGHLDKKFEKLDIEKIGSASKYLNLLLKDMQEDLFLSNSIKALSQGRKATYSHSINVAIISVAIAEKMNLNPKVIQEISIGALLHDVGKMLLPPSVLKETAGIFDGQEMIFQQHTRIGADLLAADRLPPGIHLIARQHHEKFAGDGYPDGIAGNDVHVNSFIVGLANAFDKMTSSIYQRNALTPEEAIERILLAKGIDYHPLVVEQFVELFKQK